MIKGILFLFFGFVLSYAQDCEQYFESKKAQIQEQIKEFDEAKQALQSYKASFEALQNERLNFLEKKELDINATLRKIENLKAENELLLKQKQDILNSIDEKTLGKIKDIYSQMKDSSIADILSQMNEEDATKIMLSLEARKISGILSKMDPKKASALTLLLKNIDNNSTK